MIPRQPMSNPESILIPENLQTIAQKVFSNQRLAPEEALKLAQEASVGLLGMLANHVRTRINQHDLWFIRNFHIEPTNLCIHRCRFCSFRSDVSGSAWELSLDEIKTLVEEAPEAEEVHITGGVHPDRDFDYYLNMIAMIRKLRPTLHIKAFSAVEIDDMAQMNSLSHTEVLTRLKQAGLDALPGGGAEIFDAQIRETICPDKTDGPGYLAIHREAHLLAISTNATMLYGHSETWEHRIDHMNKLRMLQDETGGLLAFIPLKFRNKNNLMHNLSEQTLVEDLRLFSIARVFLDNIPHLKAYWPMLGKETTEILLDFGVDDLDGTIHDSTRIYSMAGAEEKNPVMTLEEFVSMAKKHQRRPLRRDSLYNLLETY